MQFFVFYSSITFYEIRSNLLALFFISFLLFLLYVIIPSNCFTSKNIDTILHFDYLLLSFLFLIYVKKIIR